jgi:CubicO group peptidase (beta-lactamase class C family)
MDETGYLPWGKQRLYTAPTEYDSSRDRVLQGIVHDENTRIMGGVSGHAGLFSTAVDLAVFAQMLLNNGEFNGTRILKKETIDMMLTPQYEGKTFADGTDFLTLRKQLLGWWGMDNAVSLNYMGGLPSKTAYSHTGFTGTAICIDPEHQCAAILLSNAVHPRRAEAQKSQLRRDFFHNIAKALVGEDKVNIIPPTD